MEIAKKVRSLRKKLGMSQQEFACLTGFSYSYIQKFEEGKRDISTRHLIRFSKVLNVKPFDIIDTTDSNIYSSHSLSFNLERVEYRERQNYFRDTAVLENEIMSSISDHFYNLIQLENILGEQIKFNNPLKDMSISSGQDIETAVKALRKKWKLGRAPIYDVVYLLENKGIRVFEVSQHYDFVGFSGWAGDVPIIVLNIINPDISRRRFTALHELAHLILSFDIDDGNQIERLCNHFAGAMLLAEEVLQEHFRNDRNDITLEELRSIKLAYGISIHAIILRALTLNLINWDTYHKWRDMYDSWQDSEDADFGRYAGSEKPRRFFHLLATGINSDNQKISLAKASSLSGLTVSEVESKYGNKKFILN